MSPPSFSAPKRKAIEKSISPPPLKRKVKSNISEGAVASFFTPTSQKPKERTTWTERAADDDAPPTLLVGRYEPENLEKPDPTKRNKIAAFDLDSTLITTVSGKRFGDSPEDWKWWNSSIPSRLRQLYAENYRVVILSNQAGLVLHPELKPKAPKGGSKNKVVNFKQKCNAILAQLNLPTAVYAATEKDIFRKPRIGMWAEICRDYGLGEDEVDLAGSLFVGDAGGRNPLKSQGSTKDFSCSDRNFAHNVGIPYHTPEEYFLDEPPSQFSRDFDLESYPYPAEDSSSTGNGDVVFEKTNKQDIVLFAGPPGAGKSTFYWRHLKPLGYERVNQDILKTRAKCFKVAAELLSGGDSIVIDSTNPHSDGRKEWIELANNYNVPIRCVWFKAPKVVCEHNDAVRALNKSLNPESRTILPALAFNSFYARFKEPRAKEGFQDIVEHDFNFSGTRDEYDVWARYWN